MVATGEDRLIVDLQPQHIAENVVGSPSMQGRPAAVQPALHRAARSRHPLSVEGVFAAVNELELAGTSREQGKASTLELPWRLLLAIGRCHVG
jgi:hypothetical protein